MNFGVIYDPQKHLKGLNQSLLHLVASKLPLPLSFLWWVPSIIALWPRCENAKEYFGMLLSPCPALKPTLDHVEMACHLPIAIA